MMTLRRHLARMHPASRGARVLMAVLVVLLTASVGSSASPETGEDLQRASGVTLRDASGRVITLAELRGRIVVLNVWATWCGPCRRELPSFDRLARTLDDRRFVVALLSADEDVLRAEEYLRERGIRVPAFAPVVRAEAMAALAIDRVPTTLVLAEDGALVARVLGPREWDSPQIVNELDTIAAPADHVQVRPTASLRR